MVGLLEDIKFLLSHSKTTMNVDDLIAYTGLSRSKIYKLTSQGAIPMGTNPHLRKKFFDKETIDRWLMGKPDLLDEHPEGEFHGEPIDQNTEP